ncbi:sugar ABC transporter ATP-binding protein [Streptomyces sp. NPDC091212]|uniref:sugar ABC transporter ATP-binding protein n=1 Tax=Streptomyces sp. NPDC091212 TaxID=3155191 RepID=UPI0034128EEF
MDSDGSIPATVAPAMLECRDLYKSFGGVPVLKGAGLSLLPGTVTALAGENGAGKSTMMKIASGQLRADRGEVRVRGEQLTPGDPKAAHRLGVAIVPQELASIDDMTVYENLFVGHEIRTRLGLLDRQAMIAAARRALDAFEVGIDPATRMSRLPVGLRQIVEIVKCTHRGAKVLLLDEPTSAIAKHEVDSLYTLVGRLRSTGVSVMYTTHKMEEMRALADRVVVLRDGVLVADRSMTEVSDDDIVTAMIGRDLESLFPPVRPPAAEPVLEIRGLRVDGSAEPTTLTVRGGEILGLAGLVGAGRTELLESIFGARPDGGGSVAVDGRTVGRRSPAGSIRSGIAFVPEDRKGAGAVLTMSILDNATLPRLADFSVAGWLRNSARTSRVDTAMRSVRLRSRGPGQSVGTLSGGNQQKVVIARWLTSDVRVLLLDEPTRGVDVGARSEIYRIIADLAAEGMAVVMASSDMPEILGLSHRALVMRGGAVAAELDRDQLDHADVQATIFRIAAGLEDSGRTPAPAGRTARPTAATPSPSPAKDDAS